MGKKYTDPYRLGVVFLLLMGFYMRYTGIIKNLSFWNDESHTALMSRGILQYGSPVTAIGVGNGIYQFAYYYLNAVIYSLFGISEFTSRMLSVLAGTALILLIYIFAKKWLGKPQALIAAFICTFSQIQLAWSTQLRPYIWLELFTVITTYFTLNYLQDKKRLIDFNILFALLIAIVSFLFHSTAAVNLILVALVFGYKVVKNHKYQYLLIIIPIGLVSLVTLLLSFQNSLQLLLKLNLDFYHYYRFLSTNYWWLGVGALLGVVSLWKKNKVLSILLVSFTTIIFIVAIVLINSQYVRYSLPAFPLLYLLFSEGVIYSGLKVKRNIKLYPLRIVLYIAVVTVLFVIPSYQRKMNFFPKFYYSINADSRENPIVDYKTAFLKIQKLLQENKVDRKKFIIMDAWNDRVPWYMPGQRYVFLNRYVSDNEKDSYYGEVQISTISGFKVQKSKFQSGVVILENWPSITSPELQNYIRQTLKHEFDVNNLPYNEDDKWSISVYSWGI